MTASLRSPTLSRTRYVWLVLLLAVLAAMAPVRLHWPGAAAGKPLDGGQICGQQGTRLLQQDAANADTPLPAPTDAGAASHCLYCLQSIDRNDAAPCAPLFIWQGGDRVQSVPLWQPVHPRQARTVRPPPRGPPD